MKKNSSLKSTIWLYFLMFSLFTLIFLWIFQVFFLNSYYEWSKTNELKNIVNIIKKDYNDKNYESLFDNLAYNYEVCIELYSKDTNLYLSNNYNRGCSGDGSLGLGSSKEKFILSNEKEQKFEIINKFKNKTLMYAINIDDSYIFVNTALQPLDSTIEVLKNQFIIVTVAVLLLALIISYYISKRISKPIEKINEQAKILGSGKFDAVFNDKSDIKELNELCNTLNYTRNELAKTENLRRELLANVSHDLKTPLTMIKAYAEKVRDLSYNNKEKRENDLNVIINESDRLNVLVNDLLDLSSIEMNNILEYEEFDLVRLIKNVINIYDAFIKQNGYTLKFTSPKKVMIRADKKRMEQVMHNFLDNAINYTGSNKLVEIKITDLKNRYLIEIIDTGKGIKKENIKYIWDMYYKVDKSHARGRKGTGIGLSIVKNILVNHNFKYGVNSVINKGTVFYFEINKN